MSSPFIDGEELEDQTSGLISPKSKENKYDESPIKRHWKFVLAGIGVTLLITLGVIIGMVSNNNDAGINHGRREDKFPYSKIRLPTQVKPDRYKIFLHPNITDDKFGFTGTVRILINVTEETDSVLLHSKKLKISDVKCYEGHSAMIKRSTPEKSPQVLVKDFLISEKHEFLMIRFKDQAVLKAGNQYTLFIQFSGSLSSGLEGFYKSSYKTKDGEKQYLATTHFEATHARQAFPCFDEPALKAIFEIVMVREGKHTALSNMPIKGLPKVRKDGLYEDHFQPSVRMSTYLVAFVVCDFKFKSAKTKRGIEVKVWAPADQIEQANFAIEVAPKVLDYYETFFDVEFPLPKQDLIAIPDFAAGAMENWGLITYRLTSILYDEHESSSANKQWVAVVIAHELAHQWFGNLVTMKWWNDLWLNEGFAAFVEFIGADFTEPEWQMMDQFIVDDVQNSLTLDSSANSHPISVKVDDPAQINEIFDTISYDKGASIIRMMKNFIGKDTFHKGLTDYLKKYRFSNAVSDDLWACLTKAQPAGNSQNIDVKSVMDTWTLQMGYPLITIKNNSKKTQTATVTQEHFLIDVDAKPKESIFNYKWDVPLTFYYQKKKEKELRWFNRTESSIDIPLMQQSGWIKANADQLNFYRVNYDENNWKLLSQQLLDDHLVFSPSDRSNLIDDAFELAKVGTLDQIKALNMTAYLKKEKEYVPWITALSSLGYVGGMLQGRPAYADYEKYIVKQVKPVIDMLGWKNEGTHLQKYLRSAVLRSSVAHNDSGSVEKAMQMFKGIMNNNEKVHPDLRSTVYLAGIKYGTREMWDYMFKKYETTPYPSEQRKVMFSLADTSDTATLKRYLDMSMNSSVIRSQDTCGVIEHIAVNTKGTKMAEEFVIKNWDELFNRYGSGSFDMSSLIKTIFARMKTEEDYKKAKKFLDKQRKAKKLGSGALAAKQALNAIRNHISWLKKNEEKVAAWIKDQNKA